MNIKLFQTWFSTLFILLYSDYAIRNISQALKQKILMNYQLYQSITKDNPILPRGAPKACSVLFFFLKKKRKLYSFLPQEDFSNDYTLHSCHFSQHSPYLGSQLNLPSGGTFPVCTVFNVTSGFVNSEKATVYKCKLQNICQ